MHLATHQASCHQADLLSICHLQCQKAIKAIVDQAQYEGLRTEGLWACRLLQPLPKPTSARAAAAAGKGVSATLQRGPSKPPLHSNRDSRRTF